MTYKQILPLQNLNFQMNRVLTHGEEGCREEELMEIAPKLQEFDPAGWFEQWNMLAQRAERDGRLMLTVLPEFEPRGMRDLLIHNLESSFEPRLPPALRTKYINYRSDFRARED